MKKLNISTLILSGLLFVLFSLPVQAQEKEEDFISKEFSNPAKKGKVVVEWRNGDVVLKGYDGKKVEVEMLGRKNKSRKNRAKMRGLKKIFDSDGVEVFEENNTISISSFSSINDVDVIINIPKDTDLYFKNNLNGNFKIENFDGDIEVYTLNGDIELYDVTGPVTANSTNGDITATLVNIDPEKPMSFSTTNSDIDISFPAGTKANLRMSTADEIYTDLDIKKTTRSSRSKSRRSKSRDTGSRSIVYDGKYFQYSDTGSRSSSNYLLNGGGKFQMDIKTIHGSIYLRKGK